VEFRDGAALMMNPHVPLRGYGLVVFITAIWMVAVFAH
jgi:hypothetical protein